MRILLWHGYLLGGTGSNVYTRALAREWSRAGHEVVVFCQEPHPERFDLAGAEVVRPDIDGLLPVFVLDRYEGLEAKLLQAFTRSERERYVELNAAAIRERLPAEVVFTNHVLLGAPVGLATGHPFAVKAHGSELEYSMRGNDELSAWGRETLARADAVFDTDPEKIGLPVGQVPVSEYQRLAEIVREKNIIVGVLAVPADNAQQVANDLVGAGVKILFNYSEALLDVPSDVAVHTSNPAVELLHALYFHLT